MSAEDSLEDEFQLKVIAKCFGQKSRKLRATSVIVQPLCEPHQFAFFSKSECILQKVVTRLKQCQEGELTASQPTQ